MSFRMTMLLITLVVITTVSVTTYLMNRKQLGDEISGVDYKKGISKEIGQAVDQAKKVYQQKKALGVDFSDGPCLSNDLQPDWVADLVHVPRSKVDDIVGNQCQAFIEGRAHHFVELDLDGNLVRVK